MQRAHQRLLVQVAAEGQVVSIGPHSESANSEALNLTEHVLAFGPVRSLPAEPRHGSDDKTNGRVTIAIIELWMRADASPATYRGCEQFLMGLCDVAADYHAFEDRRRLLDEDRHRTELLILGRRVHSQLKLSATAFEVANEGRRLIDCDRLSVLMARGRRCRLLSTSGVSRFERRAARPGDWKKSPDWFDAPTMPPTTRTGSVTPCHQWPTRSSDTWPNRTPGIWPRFQFARRPMLPTTTSHSRNNAPAAGEPAFVLIAEQFDSREGDFRRDWLVEVADVCATALYNAREADRLPLRWFFRPLGKLTHAIAEHVPLALFAVAAAVAAVVALVKVPADFNVEASGTLQPVVRRDVFAPRSGIVDEVLVQNNATVAAGQPLVRMRDPALELEFKRVDGELETSQRQLDAVRATRTNRAVQRPDADRFLSA